MRFGFFVTLKDQPKVRTFAFGYRPHEYNALRKKIDYKLTVNVEIRPHFKGDYLGRPVESASLGPHLEGICQPRTDTRDPNTQALGVIARMGKIIPAPKQNNFYQELREFVLATLIKRGVKPLAPDADLSFDNWIEHTNYPEWRRKELRKINEDNIKLNEHKLSLIHI